jgi:hypothetical protein
VLRVGEPARQPDQPRERKCSSGHEHDVLSRDGEQVVEPRGAEALAQPLRQCLLVTEHDPLDDPAPVPFQTWSDRACQRRAEPVRDAAETAAVADDAPTVRAQHHVHAVATKERPLVEAVLLGTGHPHRRDGLEKGSLRRAAARRKLEQDRLPQAEAPEAAHLSGNAQLEARPPRRRGHHHEGALRRVRAREQHAAVERLQARAAPPPCDHH